MMSKTPRSVDLSARIYRTLVWAYPASFRREYGWEMVQVFRDMAEGALSRRGLLGLAGLWFRVVPDLVKTAVQQHCNEIHRRVVMWEESLGPARFVAALAVALLIAALVTPADPASMFIVGFPLYGVYLCAAFSGRLPRRSRAAAVLAGALNLGLWIGLLAIAVRLVRPDGPLEAGGLGMSLLVVGFLILPPLTTAVVVSTVALAARHGRGTIGSCRPNEATSTD